MSWVQENTRKGELFGTEQKVKGLVFTYTAVAGVIGDRVIENIAGHIDRVVSVPDDTTPPSAINLTLKDEDGIDVLVAQGAALSPTAIAQIIAGDFGGPVPVAGDLTLNIADQGTAAATGKIIIYLF